MKIFKPLTVKQEAKIIAILNILYFPILYPFIKYRDYLLKKYKEDEHKKSELLFYSKHYYNLWVTYRKYKYITNTVSVVKEIEKVNENTNVTVGVTTESFQDNVVIYSIGKKRFWSYV